MSLESSNPHAEKESYVDDMQTYRLESGVTVEVRSRVFENKENSDRSRAVVFLPGWGMAADAKSADALCSSFSKESGGDVHALSTRSEERGGNDEHPDLLYEEARALKGYIKLHGLKNITLAGHSQGGDKSINLASLLQNDPEFTLDGVVLIDAVGLYDQGGVELAAKFTKNAAVDTGASILSSLKNDPRPALPRAVPTMTAALQTGNDVAAGIGREMWRSKMGYWDRFKSEVTEMARKNPHAEDLHVPIVIVSGINDNVSDPERIIPTMDISPLREALGAVSREAATEDNPARDTTLAAREQYLKEHLFPHSPYVRMLVPEKLGVHNLPMMRPEAVAKTALYMLGRYKRTGSGE